MLSLVPYRIEHAVPSVDSHSLVLSHRKKCLIPAHRETPNSQQEETQSQMKMILSHHSSMQFSEGGGREKGKQETFGYETLIEQNVL